MGLKKGKIALMLAAILGASSALMAGCATSGTSGSTDSGAAEVSSETASDDEALSAESSTATSSTDEELSDSYYGNDISKHLDMKMYVIGDEPAMADEVEDAMNEILEKKANVTLDISYIPLSDYTTKYSLLLASGEDIDIIYSANWADYFAEARKGAYQPITLEQIAQYMPQTDAGLTKNAFNSVKIDGNIYMIPSNQFYANNAVPVLIRGDLREKYGMDKITSYDALEAYMDAVKQNEDSILPYAAGTDGVEISIQMFQCKYNMFPSSSLAKYIGYFYTGNNTPTADNMVWEYTTDEYKEFARLMKDWADKGYWSKNAVANTISPADAFINGTSATVFWNYDTCMNIYNTVMNDHPEWKPELIDPNPDGARFLAAFGQGLSIPAAAQNPERSMIVMDLLAWDKELYDIARYGIEGESWIATSDTTYQLGDRQADYTVGNSPITWGTKNDTLERIQGDAGTERSEIWHQLFDNPIEETSAGFVFDDTNVKNEIAALSELSSQYVPMIELGLVDDADSTVDEFNQKCQQAGSEKVLDEFKSQYTAYLEQISE